MATFSSAPHAEVNAENINDENGPLAVRALTSGPVGNQTSHDVRRKVDRFILPALCITYAILFIGRTLMNYCAVHGLLPDNTLSGKKYLWTVYMFYIGMCLSNVWVADKDANISRLSCCYNSCPYTYSENPTS